MDGPPFYHPWPALRYAAEQHAERDALVFPEYKQRWSFAHWYQQALNLAGGLQALDVGVGTRVALLAENRAEWALVQAAVAGLGALLVPLNTHYRRDDLAYALTAASVELLITSRQFRGNPYLQTVEALVLRAELPQLREVIAIDALPQGDSDSGIALDELHEPDRHGNPGAPAVLLYTSGTTGRPKGVLLSHRAMMMNAVVSAARLGLQPGDRWTSMIPLFHCAGCIMNLLGCLQSGAAYVGISAFDAEQLCALIERERCTHLSGVPTSYLAMLQHPARPQYDLSSLRAGTCGGADADPQLLADCADQLPIPGLCQVYGQTEGGTLLSCPHYDDPERWRTAGPALDGYQLRIIDPTNGEPCLPGEIGEIQGCGAMLMQGYDNDPQASADALSADGWLRSGDLGYLTARGDLVISGGRLRDMIIRGGENIYPAEIEAMLMRHPAVLEAAVFGVADDYYGEVVAAALRLDRAANVTPVALQQFCAERIAKFKTPAKWFVLDQFPLTPSGKIRKVALREQAASLLELT